MDEIEQNGKKYVYFQVAAQLTGYESGYLRKLARTGKIDAVRVGTAWMINLESLDEYQRAYKNRHPHQD